MIRKIACLLAVLTVISCGVTARTASKAEAPQDVDAAVALVERVTGGRQGEFTVKITPEQIDGKDWFAYYAKDGKVVLEFVLGTHSHSDHIGGLDTVILDENITVKTAYIKEYDESKIKSYEIERLTNNGCK